MRATGQGLKLRTVPLNGPKGNGVQPKALVRRLRRQLPMEKVSYPCSHRSWHSFSPIILTAQAPKAMANNKPATKKVKGDDEPRADRTRATPRRGKYTR